MIRHENVHGPEHVTTLDCLRGLASVLLFQGKHEEAEEQFQKVMETHEKVHGLEHKYTLWALEGLAECMDKQGKGAKAQALFAELDRGNEAAAKA